MTTLQSGGGHLSIKALITSLNQDPWELQFRRYLRFRGTKPGEHVALEVIKPGANSKFKFASSALAFATVETAPFLLKESDEQLEPQGCYIQQNALTPAVVARQKLNTWVPLKKDGGVKDPDVVARRAFYFDLDPVRARDVSATNGETKAALNRTEDFLSVLREVLGDDAPLGLGFSGNGVQVHVALDDLPNTVEVEGLVDGCLKAADALMSDDNVKVDTSVTDARRVCPAFGTAKCKGEHYAPEGVPEEQHRPHRRTAFICADEVRRLSLNELRELKEGLEARVPEEKKETLKEARASTSTVGPSTGDTPWARAQKVDVEEVSEWLGLGSGDSIKCPGCGAGPSSYERLEKSNTTKCLHDSCATKGIRRMKGLRGPVQLVMEVKKVDFKGAVNLLAEKFGFEGIGAKKKKERSPPPPPPNATGAAWEQDLLRSEQGVVLSTGANVELVMTHDPSWVDVLGFNELLNAVVFLSPPPKGFLPRRAGEEWQDMDDVAASNWFMTNWRIDVSELKVRAVAGLVAHRRSFHPIREALEKSTWDQTPRVDSWLSTYLGVEDSEYARTVGRWWLISAVARVMKPGCKVDTMLILEGQQGLRKSQALRTLAGDDYFMDSIHDIGGPEGAKLLLGKWVIELAELDAFRRAESSTIKRFLSQQSDTYRPSYGRTARTFPRQCVFAGTTNVDEYLHDETGARRFWPVRCGVINLDRLKADRDQIWAEGLVLYLAGQHWWPATPEEEALCRAEQKERQAEDAWDEVIREYVADKDAVSTKEVLACALNFERSQMSNLAMRRVGGVLRALGWERRKGTKAKDGDGKGKGPKQSRLFVRGPEAEPRTGPRTKKERLDDRPQSLHPDVIPHPTLSNVTYREDEDGVVLVVNGSANHGGRS